jgi:hypothetical protein
VTHLLKEGVFKNDFQKAITLCGKKQSTTLKRNTRTKSFSPKRKGE